MGMFDNKLARLTLQKIPVIGLFGVLQVAGGLSSEEVLKVVYSNPGTRIPSSLLVWDPDSGVADKLPT